MQAERPLARTPLVGRELILCVGPGGVGKTTCAASLALVAAEAGLRVAVVTVDPSKRLAQALGIDLDEHETGQLVRVREGEYSLDALVLDGAKVFDTIVKSCASSPAGAQRILSSRMYKVLAERLSGATEYAAMAQVQMLHDAGAHDLIVLDTPPTANAIDFLRAPERVQELIDNPAARVLRGTGALGARILGLGAGVFRRALETLGGSDFLEELGEFLREFTEVLREFHRRGADFESLLSSEQAAALVVTTTSGFSLREARTFLDDLREQKIEVAGVIFNRFDPAIAATPEGADIRKQLEQQVGAERLESALAEFAEALGAARLRAERGRMVIAKLHADDPGLAILTARRRVDPPQSLEDLEDLGRELLDGMIRSHAANVEGTND